MVESRASEEKLRIVSAARERFLEAGFSKVTVDELATELGMSKKTVYKFFPSKEDLLRGVVRTIMLYLENRMNRIVESDDTFETKMANVLLLVGGQVRRIRPQFLVDMRRSAPKLWEEIEEFRREKIFPRVRLIFEQAQREGILDPDVDIELFFLTFLHSMEGIMNPHTLVNRSFSADEAFQGVLRILLAGTLSESARSRYHIIEDIVRHSSTRSL